MHNKSTTGVWNMVEITTEKTQEKSISANTTCDAGRAQLLQRLVGTNTDATVGIITYVSIGTGTTPATTSDVALATETYRELVISAYTVITGTTAKVYARFPQGVLMNIAEVWLRTQGTSTLGSGTLLARSVLPTAITKNADDAVTIERTLSIVNHV